MFKSSAVCPVEGWRQHDVCCFQSISHFALPVGRLEMDKATLYLLYFRLKHHCYPACTALEILKNTAHLQNRYCATSWQKKDSKTFLSNYITQIRLYYFSPMDSEWVSVLPRSPSVLNLFLSWTCSVCVGFEPQVWMCMVPCNWLVSHPWHVPHMPSVPGIHHDSG